MAIKSDSNLPILTHDVVYSHRRYALNDKLPQAIRAIETTVEDHMRADAIMCMKSMTKAVTGGRGPAPGRGPMFLVDDMRIEQRWPGYAQHAAARGVLGSLLVPLPFQGATIGALNTYAGRSKAFEEQDVVLAQEVAGWVALATGSAEAAARSTDDFDHLRTATMSRAFIDQAKGILMERHKVTEDEAFTMLAHASQRTNTKLRDVAAELARADWRAAQSRLTVSTFLSDQPRIEAG